MKKHILQVLMLFLVTALLAGPAYGEKITQGTLQITDNKGQVVGECPLKNTDVEVDISGFLARVTVTQQFVNPGKDFIEAVYIFPMSQNAAVDDMTMKIGQRIIKGEIKEKEEARKIYEAARSAGKAAALLDQERPNIFTQSVANIPPGESIRVVISYVEVLDYTDGEYEFSFPMVVGPRYMPGQATGQSSGTGHAPDTTEVPDGSKISPPVTPKGTRAGHDIKISVNLDAGLPIKDIKSVLHEIKSDYKKGSDKAKITLAAQKTIPNKDFILKYRTAGKGIEDALLTYKKDGDGYFVLVLQPPSKPEASTITPKEMFFVIDASGSQRGWPIDKAKETMKYCIENMNPDDTFQLLSFSNNVRPCFEKPVPNSDMNREIAQEWLAMQTGSGGTEMTKAVDYSLGLPADPQKMRIVVFMTDGYVGNDMTVINNVKNKLGRARLFPFGTGNSVNRYLLEGMAKMGKGEVEWVTLDRDGKKVAKAFQDKIGNPLLLDIGVDWGNAPVSETFPADIPDLFSGKPLVIMGKYEDGFSGDITLNGKQSNKPYSRKIKFNLPDKNSGSDTVSVLWARKKIEDLMNKDLKGIQAGTPDKEIKDMIIKLGLKHRLMTQFTSFVAVEEMVINENGKTRTVAVPVEMPDGVSREGVFGEPSLSYSPARKVKSMTSYPAAPRSMQDRERNEVITDGLYEGKTGGYPSKPEKIKTEVLDEPLRNLARTVKEKGSNGNYSQGNIEVRDGKVRIKITADFLTAKMISQLQSKGLKIETFSMEDKTITGMIPVEKLDELSKIQGFVRIEPLPFRESTGTIDTKESEMSRIMTLSQFAPNVITIYMSIEGEHNSQQPCRVFV